MSVTRADFDIVPASAEPNRLEHYVRLFQAAFANSSKLSGEYLQWLYADNPAGHVIGVDAYAGGRLAAHYAMIPVELEQEGKRLLGCWSLNTATHPDFQGRGLFVKLAEEAYRLAAERGCVSVIGVANKNSTPGFLRRLGFRHLGQLSVSVGYAGMHYADPSRILHRAWLTASLLWRLKSRWRKYYVAKRDGICSVYTTIGPSSTPVFLCRVAEDLLPNVALKSLSLLSRIQPRLLLGYNVITKGLAVPLPKILWPSPWNVIYRPLTAALPDNVELGMLPVDLDTF